MSTLQQHVPSQFGPSHVSTGETFWYNTQLSQIKKYRFSFKNFNSTLFCFCFYPPGNSIERVVSTLWNRSLRWPNLSPPRGEHSSTVSRTIMEQTSKILLLTWLRRLMSSYELGKEQAMEWTSLELLSFQPPWVQTFLFIIIYVVVCLFMPQYLFWFAIFSIS